MEFLRERALTQYCALSAVRSPRNVRVLMRALESMHDEHVWGVVKGEPRVLNAVPLFIRALTHDRGVLMFSVYSIIINGEECDIGAVVLDYSEKVVIRGQWCIPRGDGGLFGQPGEGTVDLDLDDSQYMLVWESPSVLPCKQQSMMALQAACRDHVSSAEMVNVHGNGVLLRPSGWLWDYTPEAYALVVFPGGPRRPMLRDVCMCVSPETEALEVMVSVVGGRDYRFPTAFMPMGRLCTDALRWWKVYVQYGSSDVCPDFLDSRQLAEKIERDMERCESGESGETEAWSFQFDGSDPMLTVVCQHKLLCFLNFESLYFLLHDGFALPQRERLEALVARCGFLCVHKRWSVSLGRRELKDIARGVESGVVLFGVEDACALLRRFPDSVCPVALSDIYIHKYMCVKAEEGQRAFMQGSSKFIKKLPIANVCTGDQLRPVSPDSQPISYRVEIDCEEAVEYFVKEPSVSTVEGGLLRCDNFPEVAYHAMHIDAREPSILTRKPGDDGFHNPYRGFVFKNDRRNEGITFVHRMLMEYVVAMCCCPDDVAPELHRRHHAVHLCAPIVAPEMIPCVLRLWDQFSVGGESGTSMCQLYWLMCQGVSVVPQWVSINRAHKCGYSLCGHGAQQSSRHTLVRRQRLSVLANC